LGKKGTVVQRLTSTFGLPSSMSLISIFQPDPVDDCQEWRKAIEVQSERIKDLSECRIARR